ncbi:MAG: ABC transporter permease [Dehalococcoidia bacterium]|nr:ABC transporter permease [Dehalococcoidia bacterium]
MSVRRVGILLRRELFLGPKSFIFLWSVLLPIVLSLVLSLVFGTLFSDKPRLGITDQGDSKLVEMVQDSPSVTAREYGSVGDLEQAVRAGAVDFGIVLPEDFDSLVQQGQAVEITAYVWGESLAKHRVIAQVTLLDLVRGLSGREAPVEVTITTLGEEAGVPWSDRLLPLIVLMAVFIGGMFLPATSLVTEKQKRTLEALTVTPTTMLEVVLAKGILGFSVSLAMGLIILALNGAFGGEPGLLAMMLALGAIMAAELGLILGAFAKDMSSLFAVWKTGGILLFAPAFIYLFPEIPQWIGQIFPTYYLVEPVVRISQEGAGWPDIAIHVLVLIGLDVLLVGAVGLAMKKMKSAMA